MNNSQAFNPFDEDDNEILNVEFISTSISDNQTTNPFDDVSEVDCQNFSSKPLLPHSMARISSKSGSNQRNPYDIIENSSIVSESISTSTRYPFEDDSSTNPFDISSDDRGTDIGTIPVTRPPKPPRRYNKNPFDDSTSISTINSNSPLDPRTSNSARGSSSYTSQYEQQQGFSRAVDSSSVAQPSHKYAQSEKYIRKLQFPSFLKSINTSAAQDNNKNPFLSEPDSSHHVQASYKTLKNPSKSMSSSSTGSTRHQPTTSSVNEDRPSFPSIYMPGNDRNRYIQSYRQIHSSDTAAELNTRHDDSDTSIIADHQVNNNNESKEDSSRSHNRTILSSIRGLSDRQVPNPMTSASTQSDTRQSSPNPAVIDNKSSSKKRDDVKISYHIDVSDENAVIRFLLKERVFGYPHTYGWRILNYIGFMLNNHPAISICCAHRLHPFTKKKRVVVLFCSLCFSFAMAFTFTIAYYFNEVVVCRNGCHAETIATPDGRQKICVGGENDGLSYDSYEDQCRFYNSWSVSLIAGFVTTIYTSILHFLATCGCFQGRSFFQENCIGAKIFAIADRFGGVTLFVFVWISIVLLIATALICYRTGVGYSIFTTTIISEIWSYAYWFGWTLPWFMYYYPKDKAHFIEKAKRKASIKAKSESNNSV